MRELVYNLQSYLVVQSLQTSKIMARVVNPLYLGDGVFKMFASLVDKIPHKWCVLSQESNIVLHLNLVKLKLMELSITINISFYKTC